MTLRTVDPYLVCLPEIAQVDAQLELPLGLGESLAGQRGIGLRPKAVDDVGQDPQVESRLSGHGGLNVVVAHVDSEQSVRRQVPRVERNNSTTQSEDVDEPAGQQRPTAAERDEFEVPHVQTALDGDLS